MGVRAGLTQISPNTFDLLCHGEQPDLTDGNHRSIDKEWYRYYEIFRDADEPLNKLLTGDWLHSECTQTLDEFYSGEHEWYAGFVTPTLVRQISAALADVTEKQLQKMYMNHRFEFRDWEKDAFYQLKAAYDEAASSGNALMILIA